MTGRTVAGTYSIVRPYPGQLGKLVEDFLGTLELSPALGVAPEAGTSDEQTARWLSRSVAQLLVVPFHFHRGNDESRLDGIGVLLSLPSTFDFKRRVILMPVRTFSWTTSFQPRFEALKKARPELAERLIVAHEGDLESLALQTKVKRGLEALEAQRSQPPTRRPRPRPTTSSEAVNRLTERFSLPPTSSRRKRASGGWKFSLPEEEAPPSTPATSIPPASGPRASFDVPAGTRAIYEDFIDKKKSS